MKTLSMFYISAIVIAAFGISFWAYPNLPDVIATHWGVNGAPDGYSNRMVGVLLMPLILLLLIPLFVYLPRTDPFKKNWEEFHNSYTLVVASILTFFLYIHIITIISNLYPGLINMSQAIMPATGGLFVFIGYMLPRLKRNWFIGIRTPWTISNDEVWRKTHVLGSKLFIFSGLSTLVMLFSPQIGIWIFIAILLLSVVIATIYSYFVYRSETQ